MKTAKEKKTLVTSNLEEALLKKGHYLIAGLDEVGLGPLAGPAVAAAVIFKSYPHIPNLNDSKQLTPKKREELFKIIRAQALSIGFGIVPNERVDEINVYWAGKEAMLKALSYLDPQPDYLIIDGNRRLETDIPHETIIKGDTLCYSIAAASIVAKVIRDDIMRVHHETYPEYHFDSNKGYRSPKHLEALRTYGPCPLHRKNFIDVIRETEVFNNA
jgi:ribonuclease HII